MSPARDVELEVLNNAGGICWDGINELYMYKSMTKYSVVDSTD